MWDKRSWDKDISADGVQEKTLTAKAERRRTKRMNKLNEKWLKETKSKWYCNAKIMEDTK